MTEDTQTSTATPAPAPVEPTTAVVETVNPAPVVADTTTSVQPVEATPELVETTILAEAPKELESVEKTDTQTPEAKTEEVKPEAKDDSKESTKDASNDVPKEQEGQTEEAPPPVFEAFTFPEGIVPQTETLKEFTELLTGLETEGKADHAELQKFGQKAVEFHQRELQKAVTDLQTLYQKTWNETKVKWKDTFLADPEIGGNRAQTTINSALGFIRTHGGTPEQQAEFRQLMDQSGLGNHPAMIRLLAQAGRVMSEGRPLAATTPPQVAKSRTQTLYGSKNNYINK